MKRIIISTMAVLCAIGAYADDKQIVTSQKYVKDQLDLKLDKLSNLGNDKMLMYTTTSDTTHQIGTPRDIVDTLGTKTNGVYTDTTSNAVATRGAIKGGIDAKQDNISGTEGYVAIYTSTPGELSEKGIYNGGTIKGSDTLVTAKTVNDAIVAAVNSELTQVDATTGQASNNGTLWRVSTGLTLLDIAAAASGGGSSGSSGTYNLSLLTTPVDSGSACYKLLDGSANSWGNLEPYCDYDEAYDTLSYGDWMVPFTVNTETVYVTGTSACGTYLMEEEINGDIPDDQSTIQSEYSEQRTAAPTDEPSGDACYCKITSVDGVSMESQWVFLYWYDSPDICANTCARGCESVVSLLGEEGSSFRTSIFNSIQQ